MASAQQKVAFSLGILTISAMFFALGYLTRVRVERTNHHDFRNQSGTPATPSVRSIQPEAKAPTETLLQALSHQPSLSRPGAIMLQVAALPNESNALALASVLAQKGFPAFVLKPSADNFYRVQMGPYADRQSARLVKLTLEREGFQVIIKYH
jgi:cell division septation protein DedD